MLQGTCTVEGHPINLWGYDLGTSMIFYAWVEKMRDHDFFDRGYGEDEESDWLPRLGMNRGSLWFQVGMSNYSVEVPEQSGVSSDVNVEVFGHIALALRGLRSQCVPKNRDDFFDIDQFSFKENKEVLYNVTGGTVTLKTGNIHSLDFSSSEVKGWGYGEISLSLRWNDKVPHTHMGYRPDNYILHRLSSLDLFADKGESIFQPANGSFFSLDEIIKRNPSKSYNWLLGRDYHIVKRDNLPWLREYLSREEWDIIAFDTETTGLQMNFKSQVGEVDQLVGLVFSVKPGESFYVPLRHRYIDNVCDEWEIQGVLDEYFKEILETRPILAHNVSFDWKVMWVHGINCNFVEDTLTLFHLSMGSAGKVSSVNLKSLANEILGRDSLELKDFVEEGWGMGDLDFRDLPEEETRLYACADTDNTLELYLWANKRDIKLAYGLTAKKLYQLEVNFSKVIGYQEFYGHKVSVDKAQQLETEVLKEISSLEQRIYAQAGQEFNIKSSTQLSNVLYTDLSIPILGFTQSGNGSTSKDTLKKLASVRDESGNVRYPIVSDILELKELYTLYNNFLKKLPEIATEDGFMFSSVRQFLETGRVSITKPNYQSYNNTVKKYIVPREGYYFLDADYSAVEYRVLASMSGQENLIESFRDPDLDYHTVQASRMFGVPYESVSKSMRSASKGVNFGIPYGLGDRGLGAHIYGEESPENTEKAKDLRKKYFEGQEKVQAFFENRRDFGEQKLFAETLMGRRRYFDKRKDRVDQIRRAAGNMPIQGSAADLYKTGMVRFFSWITKKGYLGDVLISGFIHDEVLVEVSNALNPIAVMSALKKAMRMDIKGWAPLEIGCGFGRNWYEAKSTEIPIYLQDELIQGYHAGENELSWWDDDGADIDRIVDWEKARIFRHGVERVKNYVMDENNQGVTVKAAINSIAHEVVNFVKSKEFDRLAKLEKEKVDLEGQNDLHYTDWVACDPADVNIGTTVLDAVEAACRLGGTEAVEAFHVRNLKNPDDSTPREMPKNVDQIVKEKLDTRETPYETSAARELLAQLCRTAVEEGAVAFLDKRLVIVSLDEGEDTTLVLKNHELYAGTQEHISSELRKLWVTDVLREHQSSAPGALDVLLLLQEPGDKLSLRRFNSKIKLSGFMRVKSVPHRIIVADTDTAVENLMNSLQNEFGEEVFTNVIG